MKQQPPQIDVALLHQLLEADRPMTLHALSCALGQEPLRLPEKITTLKQMGCRIESHPQQGIRLIEAGLGCWVDYLEARHYQQLGHPVVVYQSTTSTQDIARNRVNHAHVPDETTGTIIIADEQTAGRGRLGRSWLAEAGQALLMTAIVTQSGYTSDRLMLASACAVALTIEKLIQTTTQIRWPNDVLIDQAKSVGILVETLRGQVLIGIGINVANCPNYPKEIDQPVTCLHHHGATVDRLQLADVMLDYLNHALHEMNDDELRQVWLERSSLLQQRVTVECDGRKLTGRVIDVDPSEGLLLEVEHGPVVHLHAATSSLVVSSNLDDG